MKKGFIFSLDAFFAIILFALVIFFIYVFSISSSGLNQQYFFSEDLLTTLDQVKINELDLNKYSKINNLINEGIITNKDVTILEQIVTIQLNYDEVTAKMHINDLVGDLNDKIGKGNIGTAILIGDTTIYGDDPQNVANILTRTRLAVGRN